MDHNAKDAAAEAIAIAAQIRPLLRGRGPDVQGAVLAELTATWLAGHDRALRGPSLMLWLSHVVGLIEIEAKRLGTG